MPRKRGGDFVRVVMRIEWCLGRSLRSTVCLN